ncbi:hypothetical protein MTO96_016652 [Rhipicephalus appendiculatus]
MGRGVRDEERFLRQLSSTSTSVWARSYKEKGKLLGGIDPGALRICRCDRPSRAKRWPSEQFPRRTPIAPSLSRVIGRPPSSYCEQETRVRDPRVPRAQLEWPGVVAIERSRLQPASCGAPNMLEHGSVERSLDQIANVRSDNQVD